MGRYRVTTMEEMFQGKSFQPKSICLEHVISYTRWEACSTKLLHSTLKLMNGILRALRGRYFSWSDLVQSRHWQVGYFRCHEFEPCFHTSTFNRWTRGIRLKFAICIECSTKRMHLMKVGSWSTSGIRPCRRCFTVLTVSTRICRWDVASAQICGICFTASSFEQDISAWKELQLRKYNSIFLPMQLLSWIDTRAVIRRLVRWVLAFAFGGDSHYLMVHSMMRRKLPEWISLGWFVRKLGNISYELWDHAKQDTSQVRSMIGFKGGKLTAFARKDSFNGDISKWNTSQVRIPCTCLGAIAFDNNIGGDTSQVTTCTPCFLVPHRSCAAFRAGTR